jgi:hypothetical protein
MQVARASAEPEFRRISQYPRSAGAGTR